MSNEKDLDQPFTLHAWTCKLCGGPVRAKIANACPVVQLEAWRRMATCDHCYDGWKMRRDAAELIGKLCGILDGGSKLDAAQKAHFKDRLVKLAEAFAQGHSMIKKLRQFPAGNEVGETLFDHPKRAQAILDAYKTVIESHKQPQPRDTHPDA